MILYARGVLIQTFLFVTDSYLYADVDADSYLYADAYCALFQYLIENNYKIGFFFLYIIYIYVSFLAS